MYIQITFPIADLRPFWETDTHQIKVPHWHRGDFIQNEFVRHFGHVRKLNSIPNQGPAIPYAHAKGALKLPDFHQYNFLRAGDDRGPISSPLPIRRLLVNSRRKDEAPFSCEARFDFGVKIKPMDYDLHDLPDLIDSENSIHTLINRFLDYPVKVGAVKGQKRKLDLPTAQIGPSIANLYLYSSSQLDQKNKLRKYWVRSLPPVVLLQLHKGAENPLPFEEQLNPRKVLRSFSNDNFHLWQFTHSAYGMKLPVWLMVCSDPSPETREWERLLAWNITRLHAEYQTIMHVSHLAVEEELQFTPRSPASQRFQFFINEALKQVSPDKENSSSDDILERITENHYELMPPEAGLKLMKKLSHIRKNILRDLGNFQMSKTIHSDTPIEKSIQPSLQTQIAGVTDAHMEACMPFIRQRDWSGFQAFIVPKVQEGRLQEAMQILVAFLKSSGVPSEELTEALVGKILFLKEKERLHTANLLSTTDFYVDWTKVSHAIMKYLQDAENIFRIWR